MPGAKDLTTSRPLLASWDGILPVDHVDLKTSIPDTATLDCRLENFPSVSGHQHKPPASHTITEFEFLPAMTSVGTNSELI